MMKVSGAARALFMLSMVTGATSKPIQGILRKSDIPDSGKEWVTLQNGVEFQPAVEEEESPMVRAAIRKATRRMIGEQLTYQEAFVDGTETFYDDNAQAWRLLGYYIDCNSREQIDVSDQAYRELDGYNEYDTSYDTSCARYLMWAAYIDLDYQGGGIGEYRQFDRESKTWDSTPCEYSTSERCVKMDCHETYSHYKLLGIFKEPSFDNWFDELIQHQGYCVWSSGEYNLVKQQSGIWPLDCTQSITSDEHGNRLYYHTKPVRRGRVVIGLYTDSACKVDYTGGILAEEVLDKTLAYAVERDDYNDDNNGGRKLANSIYSEESINNWNKAFDAFKICQPCKAYDMTFTDYGSDTIATCTDATGASGVNQCMRFASNTNMYTADFQDIVLASEQGSIVPVKVYGRKYGKAGFSAELSWTIIIFIVSFASMMMSFVTFCWVRKTIKDSAMEEPLMASDGEVA